MSTGETVTFNTFDTFDTLNLWLCECGHILRTAPLPEHTRQICSECLTELRAQTYTLESAKLDDTMTAVMAVIAAIEANVRALQKLLECVIEQARAQ